MNKLLHTLTTSYYEIESIIVLIQEKDIITEEEKEIIADALIEAADGEAITA